MAVRCVPWCLLPLSTGWSCAVCHQGRKGSRLNLRVSGLGIDRGMPVGVEQLFDEHYERLVVSLTVAAGSREVARDAVQDAFVAAHMRWGRIGGYDDPAGWVRRIAVNRILNQHRALQRGRRAVQRILRTGQGDEAEEAVDRLDVQRALAGLTSRQRMAVALHYLEGLTVEGTATVMGVSAGSVKTHLSRARDALRVLLEESG